MPVTPGAEPGRAARRWAGALVLALVAGCTSLSAPSHAESGVPGSVLSPRWTLEPAAPLLRRADGRALSVAMGHWADERPGAPGRGVGVAEAPVFGVQNPRLNLPEEATAVWRRALAEHLKQQGFTLQADAGQADLVIDGALQVLMLNVKSRDERHVAVSATLRRGPASPPAGAVLWTGRLLKHDDRFAGVSGNDREDLEHFLGDGLAQVARELVATTLRQASVLRAAAPVTVPAAATPAAVSSASIGQIAISTLPARAKVYLDEVYQGLSPLTLELPVGVVQLHFKLDGFRPASERVAVRRGATVELEVKFER